MTTTERPAAAPVNTAALRLSRTPWDMARAVLVLLVPVMIMVLVYVFFFGGSDVIRVDPSAAFADARAAGTFTVLEPTGLPSGWKPLSAQYAAGTLRVGYVAPDGGGVQLVESGTPADTLISAEVGSTAPVGRAVTINGRDWGAFDHALIDTEGSRTVIVKGQVNDADLERLAESLR